MLVFKPRLALVYAVSLLIFALISNRMTLSNTAAFAAGEMSQISTLVEVRK